MSLLSHPAAIMFYVSCRYANVSSGKKTLTQAEKDQLLAASLQRIGMQQHDSVQQNQLIPPTPVTPANHSSADSINTYSQARSQAIASLTSMGFSTGVAESSVDKFGAENIEECTEWCLMHGDEGNSALHTVTWH